MRKVTIQAQPEWAQGHQAVQWPTGAVVVSYSVQRNAFTHHAYWKPDWFNYQSLDSDDLFLLLATPVNQCPSKGEAPRLSGKQRYENFCRNTNRQANWYRLAVWQRAAWKEICRE